MTDLFPTNLNDFFDQVESDDFQEPTEDELDILYQQDILDLYWKQRQYFKSAMRYKYYLQEMAVNPDDITTLYNKFIAELEKDRIETICGCWRQHLAIGKKGTYLKSLRWYCGVIRDCPECKDRYIADQKEQLQKLSNVGCVYQVVTNPQDRAKLVRKLDGKDNFKVKGLEDGTCVIITTKRAATDLEGFIPLSQANLQEISSSIPPKGFRESGNLGKPILPAPSDEEGQEITTKEVILDCSSEVKAEIYTEAKQKTEQGQLQTYQEQFDMFFIHVDEICASRNIVVYYIGKRITTYTLNDEIPRFDNESWSKTMGIMKLRE